MTERSLAAFLVSATLLFLVDARAQKPDAIEAAFQKFWAARSPAEAEKVVPEVTKSGVSFDEALRRLKAGRSYRPEKTGVVKLSNRTSDGVEHNYALNIPAGYDPQKRYQVRFQLHGGVGGRTDNQPRGSGEIGSLAGAEQIYVIPYAWNDAPWWSDDQVLNFDAIVDSLKRSYNIDENRVVVAGVSDGGTGAYFIAMRETTLYASFLPLNGFIKVLANPDIDPGGLFATNLRNKPFFVVNGGKDPLYPTEVVEPYLQLMMNKGIQMEYHPQPDAGHNTSWWPQVKDAFEKFVADHPRNPDPDKLTWETSDLVHNRAAWLVIDKLAPSVPTVPELPFFDRQKASGRVDLVRNGNTIQATTKGVGSFTLLLSPASFDFTKPIQVAANGKVMFNGNVKPSIETLLKWAAHDNDRTMLYAAELNIRVH